MTRKVVSRIMMILLLICMLTFTFEVGVVWANAARALVPTHMRYDPFGAYNYAQKYWDEVCSDEYFWDTPTSYISLNLGTDIKGLTGYDCAHFVSCCIGNEPHEKGGGLDVPSRVPPTYGEPGATRLGDWLIDRGTGVEKISINELKIGDVINYDWDGDGHWDHIALYLGNNEVAAHTTCVWKADWRLGDAEAYRYIHITTVWTVDDDLEECPDADFSKIQDAVTAAIDGDSILVYSGTYTENVNVYKRLTISSRSGAETTIVQVADPRFDVFRVSTDCVTIAGFTVMDANYHEDGAYWCVAGIDLRNVRYCRIYDNYALNNNLGIILEYSSNNELIRNTVDSIHSGIYLGYSSDNIISRNNACMHSGYGIKLWHSSDNDLDHNYVDSNGMGIWLYEPDSLHNTFINNIVSNNDEGISFWDSSDNVIHHNNFLGNTVQVYTNGPANVWDDGYPSGGNYWSDYEERYPSAIELDGSGIWDTPYYMDENNQDNYPLMEPWTPLPRTISELKTEIEELGFEDEIDNQGIVKSLTAKLNAAQKLVDKGKIDEAKSILEEDFTRQVQSLADIHITVEAADLLIKSAEYIISHL